MLDPQENPIEYLRQRIADDPATFTRHFFARLFAIRPDLRELYPASMTHQRASFHKMINHILSVVPQPAGHEELIEVLGQLGRDHRKFDVLPEYYPLAGQVIVDEFAELLGDAWTPSTAATITEAFNLAAGVMRGAAEYVEGPAVWTARVEQKFRVSRGVAVIRLVANAPLPQKAGQYLEVQIPQWRRVWRNLSPSIPPNPQGELEFHVRSVEGGTFSKSVILETQVGDVWALAQAHGTMQVKYDGSEVLMIAGGTGLAPLRAILTDMSRRVDAPRTTLYYGTKYPGELYELGVLRRMVAQNPWLRVIVTSEEKEDPWWLNASALPQDSTIEHRYGKAIDAALDDGRWAMHQVLIAGSPEMVQNTRRQLLIAGVPSSSIQHDPV
ncbi:oxidoreductase [Gordonia sp. TBRC 11910]|uniref:nitric oxide dioxygenase n=1 Tax=Gordonia asplenii TaxID=2725283 RepID=A0A848L505_9ACTN|nr:FAD-binding oxidoreductase [Gordonia asplenii]NMO02698.1 oxidoreductase [Gordonia asplenii]